MKLYIEDNLEALLLESSQKLMIFLMDIICQAQKESINLQQNVWSTIRIQQQITKLRSRVEFLKDNILRHIVYLQEKLMSLRPKVVSYLMISLKRAQASSMIRFYIKISRSTKLKWEDNKNLNGPKDLFWKSFQVSKKRYWKKLLRILVSNIQTILRMLLQHKW